ncbi:P-loop containing nucleoside triphosphate hydrolase protein [Anaeromyces robustus]|uniref:p-loop containing nucleoside triphosphate hydrolase protein n=1 Tax=Anaeromyces robustus TaxID=1754192 RepID=A0A1Y1X401_9FUNG|nr:P-loop containing nucleoside triphosphate hydrolase protein [Anaeromyces robustus]|eukprot:ORX80523.1 P-loop containing nucleoside triphosphate hydrolase protein [Anaeromyces robustus]
MSFNKNSKNSKNNKGKKQPVNLVISGEKVKNVSYFQLFKYSTKKEKLMIFISIFASLLQGSTLPYIIFASLLQGSTLPYMIEILGDLINVIVLLVINVTLKKIIGINNDDILKELMDLIINSNNNSSLENEYYKNFSQNHPDINIPKIMSNFNQSDYSSYNFQSFKGNFEFRKIDSIMGDIYKYIIIYAIIGIVSFIASFLYYALLSISSSRQINKIRFLVFKSLLKQEMAWHEKTNGGELTSSIISDTLLIEEGIGPKIGILLQNLSTFIICFVVAFINGWKLTLYVSTLFPVIIIAVFSMGFIIVKYTKKSQEAHSTVSGISQEAFSQIRTIVSFGNEQKEIDRYVNHLKPTKKYGIIKATAFGICLGLIFGISYSSHGIAFIKGSQYIYEGKMTGGDVMKVFMGIFMGVLSFSGCSNIMNCFGEATGAASKLFHIIERIPKINNDDDEIEEKIIIRYSNINQQQQQQQQQQHREQKEEENEEIEGNIEFKNIHFSYPARPDIEILKGINFKCHKGQKIALVGASGSGKSTIFQLLERFYFPSEGEIFIDGKSINNYNLNWLRHQIGIVSQEPNLFDTTIAENISIGCSKENVTQQQIEMVAKLANAHDFIIKLPNGYQTKIGEKGLQLSGGQKQRICIARALMLNPKILLLDEATSALDNKSEKLVQKALESTSFGRTTLIIAHRLSTIRNCDCILVMDKGHIIESGTHDELMTKQNIYYQLVKNQEMNIKNNKIDKDDNNNDNSDSDNDDSDNDVDDDDENSVISNSKNSTINIINPNEIEDKEEYDLSCAISIVSNKSCEKHCDTSVIHYQSSNNNNKSNYSNSSDKYKSDLKQKNKNIIMNMNWKRYLKYNKSIWWANLLGCLGSIFNGIIQPGFAYILASAMNIFNEQGDQLLKDGKFWGLMFVLLGIVNVFTFTFEIGGFSIASEYLSYTFRKEMYNSMLKQEIGFFDCYDIDGINGNENNKSLNNTNQSINTSSTTGTTTISTGTGTLTAKLSTEAGLVQGLNSTLGFILEIIITIIGGFAIAFFNSWKLTLILLIISPFLFLGTFIEMNSDKDKTEERRRILETSSQVAIEAISNIKTVYALNLQNYFCQLYNEKLKEPEKRIERKHYISSIGIGFSNSVMFFAYLIGMFFGTIFIKNGELEFENMFKVLMAIIFCAMAVGRSSSLVPDYIKAIDAFNHVLEIIDRKSKFDVSNPNGIIKQNIEYNNNNNNNFYNGNDNNENKEGKESESSFKGNISFNQLHFRYPSRPDITVLKFGDKSVNISEGKMLALVGGSGCGKSTLIGLLLRWYDAQHGEVKIDEYRNIDYNIKWLRQQIGIVNQEPNLFNISIKDNIRYGKEDATDEEIYEAAKKANIHDFIISLPEGYNTLVGGTGTSQMSGGQKQRIAIARAIIRNPKILLLDEATSALDTESELIVQKALEEVSQSRTTITIAHRLSTIKNADNIVVMKEGRIIETGNHEELMKMKGEYYEMILAGDNNIQNNNN